jgi:putative transcriptional regulator
MPCFLEDLSSSSMNSYTNKFLIAEPFLKDENFTRSVIFLCSHDAEGSMGFTLNRPFDLSLDQLIDNIETKNIPVMIGGPVAMDTIHVLHQMPDLITESHRINEQLYWGGNWLAVLEGLRQNKIDLNKIRFYLGYSGWSAGQLEQELQEKTWLVTDAHSDIIFNTEVEDCWKRSLIKAGAPYSDWIRFPNDPQLN